MVRCLALLRPRQTLDSAVFVPLHRLQPVVDDLTDGPDGPAEQVSLCVDRSPVVDDLTDGPDGPAEQVSLCVDRSPVVDVLTDGAGRPAEQVSLCVDRSPVVDDLTDGAGRPANTALDELPVLPARAFRVDVVTERDP